MEEGKIKKMAPERAVALLEEDGIYVTPEQAKTILDFMYEIASLTVEQWISEQT